MFRRAAVAMIVVALCVSCAGTEPRGGRSAMGTPTLTPPPPLSPSPTATSAPEMFSFAAIGDWGAGNEAQRDIARRMCRWRRRYPFDMVVTTGDNIYETGAPEQFRRRFLNPMRCLLKRGVQFHATLGNHDHGTRAGVPEMRHPAFGMGGKRNYVLRAGGVRFVMWDSVVGNVRWLSRATRARPRDRWTVVVFHHPVYSSGAHGSTPGYVPALPRLFRRRGVDLVLNGHDHDFEMTRSLRGIRYVVTGGGGAGLRPCGRSWFTDGSCVSRHHFLYVRVEGDRMVMRAVPIAGRPFAGFSTRGR